LRVPHVSLFLRDMGSTVFDSARISFFGSINMKRIGQLFLLVLLALGPAWAQDASTNDAPATREDIEKLFTTLHIHEQMRSIMEISTKQSMQTVREGLKQKLPNLTDNDLDRATAMTNTLLKSMDLEGMLDDMIPVYQRHLTKADVAAMSAFYETPTGQKLLREQPAMTAEAMKAVQPRMEKMLSNLMDQAEKTVRESVSHSQSSNDKN
jgi:uncharacterized protein